MSSKEYLYCIPRNYEIEVAEKQGERFEKTVGKVKLFSICTREIITSKKNSDCDEEKVVTYSTDLINFMEDAIDDDGVLYIPEEVTLISNHWRNLILPRNSKKKVRAVVLPKGCFACNCSISSPGEMDYIIEDGGTLAELNVREVTDGTLWIPEGVKAIKANLTDIVKDKEIMSKAVAVVFPYFMEQIGPCFNDTNVRLVVFRGGVRLEGNTFSHTKVGRIFASRGFESITTTPVTGTIYFEEFRHTDMINPLEALGSCSKKEKADIQTPFFECQRGLQIAIVENSFRPSFGNNIYKTYNNKGSNERVDPENVNFTCYPVNINNLSVIEANRIIRYEIELLSPVKRYSRPS